MSIVGSNFEVLLASVLACSVVDDLTEMLAVVVFEVGALPEELLEGFSEEFIED